MTRKVFPKKNEIIYCSVAFEGSKKPYFYLTHDCTMDLGDEVEVPVGQENHLKIGHIVKIDCFRPEEAPFPVGQVKEIAGKTKIKKAIQNFEENHTTQNMALLMAALSDNMVWIPYTASLEEGQLVPDILENSDGCFFPAFSSREEMGDYGKNYSKKLESFLRAIAWARSYDTYELSGIVVNPFTNSFALKWDLLDIIEKHAK